MAGPGLGATGVLSSVTNVQIERNRKHLVTEIIVNFNGGINASEADSSSAYRLVTPGKKGFSLPRTRNSSN